MSRKIAVITAAALAALAIGMTTAGCGSDTVSNSSDELKQQAKDAVDQALDQANESTGGVGKPATEALDKEIKKAIDDAQVPDVNTEEAQKALDEARKQLEQLQQGGQ